MTSTASNAWMPTGRHEVNIGSSLMRALKARKGGSVKNSKAKPDREFYSFRYNFKPESVDPTKPGSIEVKKPKEEGGPISVNVVRPSTQTDHGHNYVGQEKAAREYDCVLIYDEELGTFTLEKIESCVTLHHDPRTIHAPRHANSPAPAAPQRMSASSSSSSANPPHDRPSIAKREEEEESEGEIPEPPKSKPPSKPIAPAPQPKVKPPAPAPQPTPRPPPPSLPSKPVQPPVPPKPKPRPVNAQLPPALKGANKRELPADAEEETLDVRRPVQQPAPKRAKVVPEKKKEPPPLALPGSGSSIALALPSSSSAPASRPQLSLPTASPIVSLPSAPVAAAEPPVSAVTDSDEEEWDEVQPTIAPAPVAPLPPRAIVMEEIEPSAFSSPANAGGEEVEEEELDMAEMVDAFEEELKEQLGEPEPEPEPEAEAEADPDDIDFLATAMSPVVPAVPMSMSQYAGGGGDFGEDDDYSSSEESDED